MRFRRVSPKNTLGAALRSLQDSRTANTVHGSNTVAVSRTTRGVVLQVKRRVSEEGSSANSIPRWG
jgi:hypothetical protein